MADNRRTQKDYINVSLNAYTIILDLIRSAWVIISISISVACISYIYRIETYAPYYSVSTTYMVTARGINNDLITAMKTSQGQAIRFAEILNSQELLEQVSKETGYDIKNIYIKSKVIGNSNLVEINAYGKTPQYAFNILQTVINKYPELTDKLITNATISILLAPSVSGKPAYVISPWRTMAKFFGISAGVLIFIVALLSCMKDTIRKGKDIEKKLDTNYLGELPHEKKRKRRKRGSRVGESILVTRKTISFRYVEAVEKLTRRVQLKMDKKGYRSLLITSCMENEGKSTVAANVAISLAGQGKKVILVDLDLRRPAQYKIFDIGNAEELTLGSVLIGKKGYKTIGDTIRNTEVAMAFNSQAFSNSTEIITSGHLEGLLDYLRDRFEYIIIDTPPMALAADAEVIADHVDAAMMVVREHMVRAKVINDYLDILYECKANTIGCVVNNVHGNTSGNIGSRYYNDNYRYGADYSYYYDKK